MSPSYLVFPIDILNVLTILVNLEINCCCPGTPSPFLCYWWPWEDSQLVATWQTKQHCIRKINDCNTMTGIY